jgi:uncharacterized protein involved in response to NO
MNTSSLDAPPPTLALRLLAEAPHRLLFFVGAANVLLAMAWWTLWLLAARWHWFALPQPAIYAGWMHAVVMQYQVLPPFIFGFLLTVFPRWLDRPALPRAAYVPVGVGLLLGQAATLAGMTIAPALLVPGLVLTALGWSIGLAILLSVLWRAERLDPHALSVALALLLGLAGLLLAIGFALDAPALAMFASIKFGGFALLLPIYFTVCHRMVPFFTQCVHRDHAMVRPPAALVAMWALALSHLALELSHAYAWLWLADLPLAALSGWLLWRWWPRGRSMPALLRVLYLGFAWLPLAMLLYATQSASFALTGEFAFGRAPTHALFIGFFGSLLVAMVTRVTQGHAGRPLQLGRVGAFAFVVVQAAALLRIGADLSADPQGWHAIAGLAWLAAFLPWALRSAWIYLTPRVDGRPG